jgi:hypothetical protein
MKNCISASSALVVTTMMVTLSFGCGEGTDGDTGYAAPAQMQTTDGTCNAIVARVLGTAQQCNKFGCSLDECAELSAAFVEFFVANPDCGVAVVADELNGLPGNASTQPGGPNAGQAKHIGEVICGAIEQCGLCGPSQDAGICITTDACNP